jgi:hypothetical protein
MPAGFPGATAAENSANPSKGATVLFDLLSGPKGSPFDNDKDYALAVQPFFKMDTTTAAVANANASTGALQTGIGFGSPPILDANQILAPSPGNFDDDYTVGVSSPDPAVPFATSIGMYIGGGKCTANVGGSAPAVPYVAGFGIGAGGNGGLSTAGGSRDAGAGPAYTGFKLKTVTAAATVANGAVVETGFVNRSGVSIVTGQSVFGLASAASAAPS